MMPLPPRPQSLKTLLPKGTCPVEELKKHQYVRKFIANPLAYRHIIPIQSDFAPFTIIKRTQQKGHPTFQLFFRPNKTLLLSAQQQSMNIGCNYIISHSANPSKRQNYVGKLRGNFQGDQFQLYDGGDNPNRVRTRPRKHLGFIKKEQDSVWATTNRKQDKLSFIVPKPQECTSEQEEIAQYEPLSFPCSQATPNPLARESLNQHINTQVLRRRQTDSNPMYELSWVFQSTLNREVLGVGQKSKSCFELWAGCPLTTLQAFGCFLSLVELHSL